MAGAALQLASVASVRVSTRLCRVSIVPEAQFGVSLGLETKLGCHRIERTQPCRAQLHDSGMPDIAITNNSQGSISDNDKEENFFDRLARAWQILFPPKVKRSSNAEIAKQRLKMILISDRCSVNDEAKRRIVTNIVGALSDFVEIESEEKVQLDVTSDPDLGTVYSVTVPVRRVKPEYQEYSKELIDKDLSTVEYIELSDEFRRVDIKFDYEDSSSDEQVS